MPRPRVKDEERRRVSRACDNCKRRKEKCDGLNPCNLCKRRGCEPDCVYSDVPSRVLQQKSRRSKGSVDLRDGTHEMAYSSDAEVAVESLLNLSGGGNKTTAHTPDQRDRRDSLVSNESHAPVPKMARLLRDKLGKFMFVGDSSNLAFLQMIRRAAKDRIGDCPFTLDPARKMMVEATPAAKPAPSATSIVRKPALHEAKELVRQYLFVTSGIIDLFDPADIMQHLSHWVVDVSADTDLNCSIYYLVLAIGAQVQLDSGIEDAAERYFNHGRKLVMASLLEEPSTLTIQASCLICFYLLTACRRNAAFMLFGVASRAAYALGLHRSDITKLFEFRERRTRERTWKSVRVLDLFMSASLGRPPATSEVDGGNVSWNRPSRDYDDIQLDALNPSATLRLCFILERIINEVYCRREVSVQLVESISQQYRDWTNQLSEGLHTDGLDAADNDPDAVMRRAIGVAHLKGAYYWSIIILTRPFLLFRVSEERVHASVETFADACVDSALRSMDICTDIIHIPGGIPKKLPWIINSLFVSALVFGVACLGDLDKSFPLMSSIEQARANLNYFAAGDLSARRYLQIIEFLCQAVVTHTRTRDLKQMARRQKDVSKMFGEMDENAVNGPLVGGETEPATVPDAQTNQDDGNGLLQTEMLDDPFSVPVLTTSGFLANQQPMAGSEANASKGASPFPIDYLNDAGFSNDFTFTEEFPLWSLLNDFDADPQGLFPSG
jgi:Fungal specific transcription factor domain/Fungal Zn(2)-Cys(6) binuclear cluster domain